MREVEVLAASSAGLVRGRSGPHAESIGHNDVRAAADMIVSTEGFTPDHERNVGQVVAALDVSKFMPDLLLAIDRDLGAVHVQHHPLRRVNGFRFGDQFAVGSTAPSRTIATGMSVPLRAPRFSPIP